jgi:CO/xanthine dehydrogenase FAD-binding subunit
MCWPRCGHDKDTTEGLFAVQSFEWIDATSVEHAAGLLAATTEGNPVLAKAGGIDLLDLMKEGILAPARLVNLKMIAFSGRPCTPNC